jgi:alpha-D-xyloside xylohydrolase
MKNKIVLFTCSFIFLVSVQISFSTNTVKRIPNGIQIEFGDQHVKARFYAGNIVRITKWLPEIKPDSSSLVVIQKELPSISLAIDENDIVVTVGSEKLKLLISKTDGTIKFFSGDGKTLLMESEKASLTPVDTKKEKAYSIKQQYQLTSDEGIYGLGQHQYGYMNYRRRTVKLVQTNTDAVTPFLISTMNYGILWDNYSKTIFTDNEQETSL